MNLLSISKILRSLILLRRREHLGVIWQSLRTKLYSDTTYLGLRRDLSLAFKAADAKVPLEVRPLNDRDDLSFLDIDEPGISQSSALDRVHQLNMLKSGIRTCYIAQRLDGRLCYMQWLIPSAENNNIQDFYGDIFPFLKENEALLEGAYTAEDSRGQGIMACAMAQIAEKATDLGARWVITFVGESHIASLKGCMKAGFVPYVRRREIYRFFIRNVTFTPLSQETPYRFDSSMNSR